MSHKLAKLIKYNKHNYQASKSASSKYLGRRLGDRPLLPSSIANVTTGTFAGLIRCIGYGRGLMAHIFPAAGLKILSTSYAGQPAEPSLRDEPVGVVWNIRVKILNRILGCQKNTCHHPSIPIASVILLAAVTLPAFLLAPNTQAKPYSMTVTIDNSVIDMNVSPSRNGSFSKSSNSTVSVSTTNASGYTLSIAASSNNDGNGGSSDGSSSNSNGASNNNDGSKLINSNDSDTNTNYLPSITEQDGITEEQYKTLPSDGSTSPYNNTWAYLPSMWDGQANTLFRPSPTKAGDVLDHTTTANPEANKYTLAIGARVDTTQRIGSYSNTYVVLATANGTPYTITYKDDTITNFPADESATAEGDKVTISSNTPNRPGYTFLGWCAGTASASKVVHNANGTDTCNGTSYTAGDTWTIDQTIENNNLVLYAMWGDNYTIDAFIAGGGTMQDLGTASLDKKSKIVASMPTETNYTLKDSRDQQEYTIAKLKDGQIWMTRNLNIAGGAALDASNTDIPAAYTLPIANGFQGGNRLPASSTIGFNDGAKAFVYNSNNTDCGGEGQNVSCFSYYTYVAATAGSGLNVTGNGEDAAWSICPKGWRLPTSGRSDITDAVNPTSYKKGDFYRLVTAYGVNLESQYYEDSTTFYGALGVGTPANFLLSGYYSSSGFESGGDLGNYQSATGGANADSTVSFDFHTWEVNSASDGYRGHGFSIRCILK